MKPSRLITLFLLIPLFCFSQSQITGKVIKVSDGDTFTIFTEKKEQIRIRLYGIDAPEKKQVMVQNLAIL